MERSGAPVLTQCMRTPVTALTILALVVIWFWLWNHRISADKVAFSYNRVVKDKEIWRVFSAAYSHLDVFHVLFNLTSLWSCRPAELYLGSWAYFMTTLAFVVSSKVITLCIYHGLHARLRQSRYLEQLSLGYSAVIFAWMTFISIRVNSISSVGFLFFDVPSALSPFVSLLITQLIVRNASFVGHFSGIIAGYLAGGGLFDWVTRPFWAACSLLWLILLISGSVKATTAIPVPCIDYVSWARGRGTDAEITSSGAQRGAAGPGESNGIELQAPSDASGLV